MSILTFDYKSKALMRCISLKAFLPFETMHPDRSTPAPWKTLYFLHGITEDAEDFSHGLDLATLANTYGIAIVIPNGENSFYMNQPQRNANYEDLVAEEIVNVTREILPLSTRYEDTWIGGISMGGYGSLMVGLRHSGTFSKIAALSPACQIYSMVSRKCLPPAMIADVFGSEENYLAHYDPLCLARDLRDQGKKLPQLFMRCGTDDHLVYPECSNLYRELTEAGIPMDYDEGPGAHTTEFWNGRLKEVMDFLTGVK